MNVLELFSGTGSVGKICEELGWTYLSLDNELPADINIDILEWDYKQYPNDTFDIVWASCPCELWSRLQNCWIGRKRKDGTIITKEIIIERINKYGKPLVDKTREIIDYFATGNPNLIYFIENPASSRMKDYITDLPNYVVSYCKYVDWGYRKDTRIWSNVKGFIPKTCNNDCNNMITIPTQSVNKQHKTDLGGGTSRKNKQHKTVLGGGYEILNGKKVLCNTKEKRIKRHKLTADGGGDKRNKHKLTMENFGGGTKITTKDMDKVGKGTNRIDRYRIPPELIRELFICVIST